MDRAIVTPPVGESGLRAVFGDIRVEGDQVVSPSRFESKNIVRVTFLGLPVRVHCLVVIALQRAERAYLDEGDPWRPKHLGGFYPRIKRGGTRLSVHSWGAAIDVDPDENPFIPHCAVGDRRRYVPKMSMKFVSSMKFVGWRWGGDWENSYDPMHFQFLVGY